jgi:hypothetical protein
MIDYIQGLFDKREFVDKCKKLIAVIAFCAIAACVLIVFSPLNRWIIVTMERVKLLTGTTWREFINSSGVFIILFFVFVLCILYFEKIGYGGGGRVLVNILYLCIVGILAVSTYMAYIYGRQWLNSDMSSEMVLGNLLAKENRLVTSNWVYSTEIRLVYQQLFFVPLFKLFDDWRVVRAITLLLNNIVLLASYFFMMRQFSVSKKIVLFTSLFLVLPVSMVYWEIVLFGGYYVFFIAMFFCYLGLFAILLNSGKKSTAAFIFFALLSFVFGVGGIRGLMNIQVPVLVMALCACFIGKNTKFNSKPFLLSVVSFVLCVFGYAVNFLLHYIYEFHSHHGAAIIDLRGAFFQQLGNTIYGFVEFLGFTPNAKFMSPQGILSFASIIVVFLIFYEAVKIIKRHHTNNKMETNILFVYFFIVSSIYHVVLFQVIDGDFRHLIPLQILYVPVLAIIFEFAKRNMPFKNARLFICGIAFVIIGSGLMRLCGLPFYDSNNYRKDSIAYLEENNLRFGLATFWNANVLTELTNGRIETLGLHSENIRTPNWLRVIAYENPDYHKGETFLLLTKDEVRQDEKFAQYKPDYEDYNFVIFRYSSAAAAFDDVFVD